MTIEELQRIIELADLLLIEKHLRTNGFLNAKITPSLSNASLADIVHADGTAIGDVCKGNLLYRATLYKNVKSYENYVWVWLEVLKVKRETKKHRRERKTEPFSEITEDEAVYFPHQIILYAKENG